MALPNVQDHHLTRERLRLVYRAWSIGFLLTFREPFVFLSAGRGSLPPPAFGGRTGDPRHWGTQFTLRY